MVRMIIGCLAAAALLWASPSVTAPAEAACCKEAGVPKGVKEAPTPKGVKEAGPGVHSDGKPSTKGNTGKVGQKK